MWSLLRLRQLSWSLPHLPLPPGCSPLNFSLWPLLSLILLWSPLRSSTPATRGVPPQQPAAAERLQLARPPPRAPRGTRAAPAAAAARAGGATSAAAASWHRSSGAAWQRTDRAPTYRPAGTVFSRPRRRPVGTRAPSRLRADGSPVRRHVARRAMCSSPPKSDGREDGVLAPPRMTS